MIYRVKEKFWSIGDKFTIFDQQDNEKYFVIGKAFSWGDKLSFQDGKGRGLAYIEQKLLSWRPRYNILIGGKPFAEITKEFTWLKKKFRLDVPGPNDYTIDGEDEIAILCACIVIDQVIDDERGAAASSN